MNYGGVGDSIYLLSL